jgi:hypothetical protein
MELPSRILTSISLVRVFPAGLTIKEAAADIRIIEFSFNGTGDQAGSELGREHALESELLLTKPDANAFIYIFRYEAHTKCVVRETYDKRDVAGSRNGAAVIPNGQEVGTAGCRTCVFSSLLRLRPTQPDCIFIFSAIPVDKNTSEYKKRVRAVGLSAEHGGFLTLEAA